MRRIRKTWYQKGEEQAPPRGDLRRKGKATWEGGGRAQVPRTSPGERGRQTGMGGWTGKKRGTRRISCKNADSPGEGGSRGEGEKGGEERDVKAR